LFSIGIMGGGRERKRIYDRGPWECRGKEISAEGGIRKKARKLKKNYEKETEEQRERRI